MIAFALCVAFPKFQAIPAAPWCLLFAMVLLYWDGFLKFSVFPSKKISRRVRGLSSFLGRNSYLPKKSFKTYRDKAKSTAARPPRHHTPKERCAMNNDALYLWKPLSTLNNSIPTPNSNNHKTLLLYSVISSIYFSIRSPR